MTEINIKITKLSEEDRAKIKLKGKDPSDYMYKYKIITGEKSCEQCNERMKCITDKAKCKLYQMDGMGWFCTEDQSIGKIVEGIKKEAGEL